MVRRVILLSALCALAVGLASCGQSKVEDTADPVAKTATAPPASDAKESPSYRIALVMKAGSNPFFAAMEAERWRPVRNRRGGPAADHHR